MVVQGRITYLSFSTRYVKQSSNDGKAAELAAIYMALFPFAIGPAFWLRQQFDHLCAFARRAAALGSSLMERMEVFHRFPRAAAVVTRMSTVFERAFGRIVKCGHPRFVCQPAQDGGLAVGRLDGHVALIRRERREMRSKDAHDANGWLPVRGSAGEPTFADRRFIVGRSQESC